MIVKLEVIRQCAVDGVVQTKWTMVDLLMVHEVLACGRTIIHHQILLLLPPVPLCSILRVAMLHHQDAPPSCWCGEVGQVWRLLTHHHWRQRWRSKRTPVGGHAIPGAQVTAAAVGAAVHASCLRAAVVITDASGGGAAELVELFVVLCQSGIGQVTRRGATQSAELIVRGLETRVEEGGVKVISVEKEKNIQI